MDEGLRSTKRASVLDGGACAAGPQARGSPPGDPSQSWSPSQKYRAPNGALFFWLEAHMGEVWVRAALCAQLADTRIVCDEQNVGRTLCEYSH